MIKDTEISTLFYTDMAAWHRAPRGPKLTQYLPGPPPPSRPMKRGTYQLAHALAPARARAPARAHALFLDLNHLPLFEPTIYPIFLGPPTYTPLPPLILPHIPPTPPNLPLSPQSPLPLSPQSPLPLSPQSPHETNPAHSGLEDPLETEDAQ